MKKLIFFALLISFADARYILKPSSRPRSELDRMSFHRVADMRTIPQDPAWYAKQFKPMPKSKQMRYNRNYDKLYFKPWSMKSFGEPMQEMEWAFRMVQRKPVYDKRHKVVPAKSWQWWVKNSNFGSIDSVRGRAISVRHTNMRALPTLTTAYRDPWKNTEGFPFDYNQNSALYPNTPLYISHYSLDKRWAFVHSPDAYGWVRVRDIAITSSSFIKMFKTGQYGIVIRDNMRLYDGKRYITMVKMGTIFPISHNGKSLLIATKNSNGRAKLVTMRRPKGHLVAPKPISFSARNITYIARQLKKDPYGWGGIRYGRDCSATTRDFYGVFGIFLHRNSSDQSKDGTEVVNIKPLKGKAKKDAILANAKPFLSMLYVPGHIGIYIGQYKGEPIIMHTYWGVRLKDSSKYTLSHTIITTIEPGKEMSKLRRESMMSNTLQKIINL